MTQPIHRRSLLAATAALSLPKVGLTQGSAKAPGSDAQREWYELRRYLLPSAENRELLLAHLQEAWMPAAGRIGLSNIGVFVSANEPENYDVHLLLPLGDLGLLASLDDQLAGDPEYRAATKAWIARTEPVYDRVESRLLHAFRSIPRLERSEESRSGSPRLFEMRTYESVNADAARRKVAMFDEGETQLMRDVGLAPLFFGATRIGHDVPNLTYMLAAPDEETHKAHWQAFLTSPEWAAMKDLPRFAGTVSKIISTLLRPADCSQI